MPLIKGGPLLFGFSAQRMMIGALIGIAFGVGLGLIYGLTETRIGGRTRALG